MGILQDFKENIYSTVEIMRGDDVDIVNKDEREASGMSRRRAIVSAGSLIAGWEGAKRTPGAAVAAGNGVGTGLDRAGDAVFGNNDIGLNVYSPSPNDQFEGEIPYDIAAEVEGEAVFDMMLDGEEIISQTLTGDEEFEGALTPEESGTYVFGVGLSPQSNNPGDVSDVSKHQEHAKFRVEYNPEDALEPGNGDAENNNGDAGNNDGEVDEGLDFGSITEEDYLEQSSRSRTRFETRLDEEYGEFLDEMRVVDTDIGYILDRRNGDTDYGGLRLDGDYKDDDGNVVGFDQSFAEDLHELSRDDGDEFTDLLEYAEGRAD
ncbi:MAG: hypothetical protein R6V35_04220 [Candidatus Nanohaloarchaea archaeon]